MPMTSSVIWAAAAYAYPTANKTKNGEHKMRTENYTSYVGCKGIILVSNCWGSSYGKPFVIVSVSHTRNLCLITVNYYSYCYSLKAIESIR